MANTKKLPKDFWDTIEKHLPGYYSRQDVADNIALDVKNILSPCDKECAKELGRSNRKLYAEACAAAAQLSTKPRGGLTP